MKDFEHYKQLAESNLIKGNHLIAHHFYKRCLSLCRKGTLKYQRIESCIDDLTDDIIKKEIDVDVIELSDKLKAILN